MRLRFFFGFRLVAGIFLLVLAFPALATPPRILRFETAQGQGAESLAIKSLLQDRQGFIWIATFSGLIRHDGYRFITYRNDPENPRSLPNDNVLSLFEDSRGRLWAGTNGGLARFDPENGGFTLFVPDRRRPSGNVIRKIVGDEKGGMWLGTYGGLQHFDPNSGTFQAYRHEQSNSASIATDNVSVLTMDAAGGLWLGTWPGGLDYLAPGASTFRHFPVTVATRNGVRNDNIRALRFDRRHRLWIGTDSGVFLWQPESGDWSQRIHLSRQPGMDSLWVNNILEDRDATIWVATRASGLLRWDEAGQKFIAYRPNQEDPHSLKSNYVEYLMQDRSGILWIGSFSAGISRVNLASSGFEHLFPRDLLQGEPYVSNLIYSITGNKQGRLWLGGDTGLCLFDPATRKIVKHFSHDPKRPGSLGNNRVNGLFMAPDGLLWIGTPTGLNRFDVTTERFEVIHFGDSSSDFISTISPGRNGVLWLGTAGGLIRFDPKSGAVKKYTHDPATPYSRSVNSTSVVMEDRNGRLWAGGWYAPGGLDSLDPASGRFRNYRHNPLDSDSLKDDNILAMTEDRHGTLWIGTGKGLNRLDFEPDGKLRFRGYTMKDGLSSNTVNTVGEDATGQIWINDNTGLSRLDPASGKITNFFGCVRKSCC